MHRAERQPLARAPSRRSRARRPRRAGRGRRARSAAMLLRPPPSRTAGAARAGTGSRSSSRASAAACRRGRRTACRPSASCRRSSFAATNVSVRRVRGDAGLLAGSRAPSCPRRSPGPYWPRTTSRRAAADASRAAPSPSRSGPTRRVKSIGRLHRGQRDELEQVVLEDVADRARLLVERGAALDPDRLGDGDLDVVDELAVPDRLEDPVREPQREQVLDGLLAEVVVDPEDLALVEVAVDLVVQPCARSRGRCRTASRRSGASSRVHSPRRCAELLDERSRSRSAGPRGRRRGCRQCRARRRAARAGRSARPRRRRRRSRWRRSACRRRAASRPSRRSGRGRTRAPPPSSAPRNSASVSSRARDADDREAARAAGRGRRASRSPGRACGGSGRRRRRR